MNWNAFREEVRGASDIVNVVEKNGVSLKKVGKVLKGLCPFHPDEKTPSFTVYHETQSWFCFGCGKGGDVFEFLKLYEKKSFMVVLADLAEQAGIPVPVLTAEDRERIEENRAIENILTETTRLYHQCLTAKAQEYLTKERGFTEETISHVQIGYAEGGLREHLVEECGLPLDLCIKAGVLRKTSEGAVRDYFYHRIVFPNLKWGRTVHITGRSLDGQEPKYLHLPGEIRYLYNEDALLNKELHVTEGIPDCLSAIQRGYPTIAIFGSSNFKPEYLPKFSRCETIYLCLDGDDAGEKGALRIGEIIGERARIIRLPEGLDLNDYFKDHTKDDFNSLIQSATNIIKYELSLIPADTDKTELPRKLEPILRILARMEKAKAEAYLSYEIKPRFELKKEDIDGYRELVKRYRREETQVPSIQTASPDASPVYKALFDGLVDLVEHNGNPAFLVKEGSNLSILPQVEREGIVYVPPPKEQIPWLLPRGEEILRLYEVQRALCSRESDGALYDDLIAYHKGISELPGDEYYDLIVSWDFHTYLLETVQYSPIICLFAVPERGKTRTGKGMIFVAYRGIHVESLRDAYLVRVAKDAGVSIFFDVRDIWKKAEKNGTEDILLHRFERGVKVPRVLYPDRGAYRDIVYYSVFGPTIISTNESVHRILETRAIPINMPETTREFDNDVTTETSLPLKERLVVFRARHLGEALPEVTKPARGRLGDILKPLQQIIRLVKPEREIAFLKLVRKIEGKKLIEKADSLEAEILETISGLENLVENNALPIKQITDAFNNGKSEKYHITYQRVGRKLSSMGFEKLRAGNNAAILWDPRHIGQMIKSYGLKLTHETQETRETYNPAA